jgi:hypothetical protein
VVELQTGQRLEGRIREITEAAVSLEIEGQPISFPRHKVRGVFFGAWPTPSLAPSGSAEAVKALKALQSMTGSSSVRYLEYASKVTDTKTVVDRYLSEPMKGDAPARTLIHDAMGLHVFASSAWHTRVSTSGDPSTVATNPMIERCPALQRKLAAADGAGMARVAPSTAQGVAVSVELPTIWGCAADKLAEAERLLK